HCTPQTMYILSQIETRTHSPLKIFHPATEPFHFALQLELACHQRTHHQAPFPRPANAVSFTAHGSRVLNKPGAERQVLPRVIGHKPMRIEVRKVAFLLRPCDSCGHYRERTIARNQMGRFLQQHEITDMSRNAEIAGEEAGVELFVVLEL